MLASLSHRPTLMHSQSLQLAPLQILNSRIRLDRKCEREFDR